MCFATRILKRFFRMTQTAEDQLLALFSSHDDVVPFCRDFLDIPVSTIGATVTRAVSVVVIFV